MSDDTPPPATANDPLDELRARAEALERQLAEVQQRTEAQLIRAELKAEAIRAGMVDLDGLKLIDPTEVKLSADGEVEGAPALMTRLKKAKPWLFSPASLSSTAALPPARAPRQKLATEMTDAEYRVAREAVVKNRR
jgi:hypothetical protein